MILMRVIKLQSPDAFLHALEFACQICRNLSGESAGLARTFFPSREMYGDILTNATSWHFFLIIPG